MPSLGVHYNDLIDHATNCEVPALAGSILECRASAPIHLWGQLDYQWRKADGDSEAGTAKARRFTGLIGVDANVGTAAIVGASLGYVTNHVRTKRFGETVDGDGFQVGLYGAYDPGQFYVKAVGTYSWFNGDSSRHINFAGLAPGATFASNPRGDPDSNMWTFGLHGGYRIGMGGNSVVTPYLTSIPLYGGLWMMACCSAQLDPHYLTPLEVDRRIAQRGIGDLQYFNGDVHRGSLAMPNFVRALVD